MAARFFLWLALPSCDVAPAPRPCCRLQHRQAPDAGRRPGLVAGAAVGLAGAHGARLDRGLPQKPVREWGWGWGWGGRSLGGRSGPVAKAGGGGRGTGGRGAGGGRSSKITCYLTRHLKHRSLNPLSAGWRRTLIKRSSWRVPRTPAGRVRTRAQLLLRPAPLPVRADRTPSCQAGGWALPLCSLQHLRLCFATPCSV